MRRSAESLGRGSRAVEIVTVGHSTHPIEVFIGLLQDHGIEAIADVRRFPGSRRHPQFGARALATALAKADVAYESFADALGGRRSSSQATSGAGEGPGRSDNSAWRNVSFRAYADYMSGPAFATGLLQLEDLARSQRTAIMCAEAHPSRCHRRLIADALLARGWRVLDLLGDGRIEAHAPSPHAVFEEGRVSYPRQAALEV